MKNTSEGGDALREFANQLRELAQLVIDTAEDAEQDSDNDLEGFNEQDGERVIDSIKENLDTWPFDPQEIILGTKGLIRILIDENIEENFLSYSDVVAMYIGEILPAIVRQYEIPSMTAQGMIEPDIPARREAFNDFTDSLCKDGQITAKQYDEWGLPDNLEG